jgi:hypothetical protein
MIPDFIETEIVEHSNSFQQDIVCFDLNLTQRLRDRLYTDIKQDILFDPRTAMQTNVKSFMTDCHLNTPAFVRFQHLFRDEFYKNVESFVNKSTIKSTPLEMGGCWGAIYKGKSFTTFHDHNPNFLSFIYYLKSDENSSPTTFKVYGKNKDGVEGFYDFKVKPVPDLAVVFSPWIRHGVLAANEKTERVIIAGNIKA